MAADTELEYLTKIGSEMNPVQRTRYNELLAQQPATGISGVGDDLASFMARQRAEEQALLGQFQTQIAGQEALPQAYQRLTTEQGIPGLQTTLGTYKTEIAKTKDLLDRLEEDITERTRGTLTTEAQRRRQVAAEEQPLQTTLGRLGTGMAPVAEQLTSALGNVQTMLGLTAQEQERQLQPIKLQISMFSDRAAREMTGYTQERKNQLDLLMQQISEQGATSRTQMQLASDLAKQEQEFENQKALIQSNMEANIAQWQRTTGTTEGTRGGLTTSQAVSDISSVTAGSTNPKSAAWYYIHNLEQNPQSSNVDFNRLWSIYNALPATSSEF